MSPEVIRTKPRLRTLASSADRYELYLQCVQEPSAEVAFFDRVFRKEFARPPKLLREDFCGTAAICYEWVAGGRDRRSIGVDIDPEPLEWGRRLAEKLTEGQRSRVQLLRRDVRDITGEKADVVGAQNFSFWVFKTRQELRRYFRAAYKNLAREGLFVLDMMGGHETFEEGRIDRRRMKGFTYIWEQSRVDPITHDSTFYIHFRFPDGSEMKRAFEYHWRLWTIPEVRELLLEAGFKRADVYWEGTEKGTGKGNGVYHRREHAQGDPAWVAYVVGIK